jgi:hypothetical protein
VYRGHMGVWERCSGLTYGGGCYGRGAVGLYGVGGKCGRVKVCWGRGVVGLYCDMVRCGGVM